METRDLLIVRQVCLKAAAEVTAAHPELEVAYDPEGKPLGPATVDMGGRVIALAAQFEEWAMRDVPTGGVDLEAASKAASNGNHVGDFDIDQCPVHKKSAPSQYNKEKNPLYCPTQGCEWARSDFFNDDEETGETVRVTKYRMKKGDKWQYGDQFTEMLKREGVL